MKCTRNYYILCIIAFLQGFVFYGPIATVYRQARGISIYDIFIIESVFMVLMILFEIPWGHFADRFGYKNTLVISFFLFFISKIIFYKAAAFSWFLAERILLALSISGISGCDSALLYSSVGEALSQKAFSRYSAASIAGFLIATLASTYIISISMDLSALLTIFPYGAAVILALFLTDIKAENKDKLGVLTSLRMGFADRNSLKFIMSVALILEASHSVTVFLNQLQYGKVGIEVKYYGIILAAIQTAAMLSIKTYKLTDKYGESRVVTGCYAAIAISSMLLCFTGSPYVSVLLIAVISAAGAVIVPISGDIQNRSISIANRATILSAYAMIIDITSAITNLIVGKSAGISLQTAFLVCGLISLCALYLSFSYFGKMAKNSAMKESR